VCAAQFWSTVSAISGDADLAPEQMKMGEPSEREVKFLRKILLLRQMIKPYLLEIRGRKSIANVYDVAEVVKGY
jgi:hypothetical protein